MAKLKVELNKEGVKALLQSQDMEALLESKAAEIANRCGTGYAHDTSMQSTRVIASAYTDSVEAAKDNAQNNTLLRALK